MQDQTDLTKQAPGADPDEPGRGFQGRVPASSDEAQTKSDSPQQVVDPARKPAELKSEMH